MLLLAIWHLGALQAKHRATVCIYRDITSRADPRHVRLHKHQPRKDMAVPTANRADVCNLPAVRRHRSKLAYYICVGKAKIGTIGARGIYSTFSKVFK